MLISTDMRKEIIEKVELPEGIKAEIDGNILRLKKDDKEITRKIPGLKIKIQDKEIEIKEEKATKNEKKLIKTIVAHIKNMIKGLNEDFIYKLKICSVHFPMSVNVEKQEVVIKNFLGEVKPRKAKIPEKVEVKVDKDMIIVKSFDKEAAGQTAANIEKTTRVRSKDRRVFQDGIFIVEKAGEEI